MNQPDNQPEGIAIIGMAGRFPGARNIGEFWQNLLAGAETITQLTDAQLASAGLDPASVRAAPGYVAARGLIERPEWFDAGFFGITPKEAEVMDPQQRVFLEEAWTALEDAGCDPARYTGSIGVFAGMSNNTYFANNVASRPDVIEAVGQFATMIGNEKDYLATRVAYKLDLRGPALSIYTACSTSLVAVCQACTALLTYQCDTALAGGISISFPQERGYQWTEGGITSSDGHCRAFDAAATGTVFSSGTGIVVLKRLADALADGDQVYAVIKGSAVNNDGAKKVSFTAPSADGHAEVIALAQALAGFAPETISYIEAHGTGTPLGDPIEIAGLTQAFRAGTDAKNFCAIGSVKTNIGHLDAAAGVAGLIKTALALQHRVLPASLHLHTPNPKLDLGNTPFRIHTATREWEPGATPRRAGVSSFGVGGTNAHVVLEEAPAVPAPASHRSPQLIVLSARSLRALEDATTQLGHFLQRHPGLPVEDVACTLQHGRRAFAFRRFVVAASSAEAGRWLLRRDRRRVFTTLPTGAPPPSDSAEPLTALGHRWLAGEEIDWTAHAGGNPRRKVSLPTYPFERRRHWVEPRRVAAITAGGAECIPPESLTPAPAAYAGLSRSERLLAEVLDELRKCSGLELRDADPSASFTELGFDSLFLTQAGLALQKRFGVPITFRRLLEEMPTPRELAAWLNGKIPQAPAPSADTGPAPEIFSAPEFPLTDAQMELLLATQMGPEAASSFNESVTIRLRGALDAAALGAALCQLVARHEAFRTTFSEDGQTQRVAPVLAIGLPLTDLSALGAEAQARALTEFLATETTAPFDLQHGPLLRATLVKLAEDHHDLVLTVHHIVCDGWSFVNLAADLAALYSGRPLAAPHAFREYARWLQGRQASPDFAATEDFWLRQFSDLPPSMELPADHPRGSRRSYRGARCTAMLPRELLDSLKHFSATQRCTLFTTMLAAFQVLLHRLTGQADLVTGIPFAGQSAMGCGDIAGHCVNFLPIRARMAGDPDFLSFLGTLRTLLFEAFEHQNLTFGALLQRLALPRDASRMPLLGVTFNLDRNIADLDFAGLDAEFESNPKLRLGYELFFNLIETEQGIQIDCAFNRDLFEPATIDRWLGHYLTLFGGIVADPSRPLSRLPLLTPEEQRRLLVDWNDTAVDFPREKALHQLVEETVRRVPDACAILDRGERVTYRELDCRANRLAHRLRALGAQPGAFVGVCLERSADLIAALLGILKTGAAYVPLDPNAPRERLAAMLADAQPCAVLCDDETAARHPGLVWEKLAAAGHESTEPVGVTVAPESLAYLIYTSGSTGVPKGVALEHRSAVNFVNWALHTFSAEELAGVLAATSICFDLSIFEIFAPLAAGGTVVLAKNILELPTLPEANEVTLVNTVPSALAELVRVQELPKRVRTVFLAGEPLPTSLVDELFASGTVRRVCDGYGPTETGYATFAERKRGEPAHIGGGIDNARLYILDAHREPVPPGATGEIFIGGAGVARGYWRRDDITAQKFLASPFVAGDRLYQTGDLARWRADGSIVYLGRADAQVKMRGYRVELGEIEAVLRAHPAVADAAVLVQAAGSAQARLIAYLVPRAAAPSARDLRAHLKTKLPDYMLPAAFVALPRLPLTTNGKLDRRALPEPELERDAEGAAFTAPRTAAEIRVAEIWRQVLRLDRVSIHDDFFEIGGHSLLAAKLVAEVDRKLGHKLPIAALFQSPTIESLARRLEEEDWTPLWNSLVPLQPHGSKPPIFFVHGVKGDVYGFLELSKLLPADQPSYGIQAIGLDGKTERHVTVEDMAACYVKEIVAFQPEGPLHLSGFSLGGLIAYEIAQQLHRRGRRVALLALLDSGPIGPTPWRYFALAKCSYLSKRSLFHLRQLWRGAANQGWFEYTRKRFASLLHYVDLNRRNAPVVTAPPQKGSELPEVPGFIDYYHAVGSAYRLLPYPDSLDLFVSVYGEDNWRWYWKWLVRGRVTFHAFPGEHMDLLFNPRGRALLAKFLTALLERTRQKEPANTSQRREPVLSPVH